MKDTEMQLTEQNGHVAKEPLHVTISAPGSNDRRSKWLNDKIHLKNSRKLSDRNKVSDSGYIGESVPSMSPPPAHVTENNNTHDEEHPFNPRAKSSGPSSVGYKSYSSEKWRPSDKDNHHQRLRNTCSLNCTCHRFENSEYLLDNSATVDDDETIDSSYCLSRQNGIRHSARHHLHHRRHHHAHDNPSSESNYSISSESEGSHNEIESPLGSSELKFESDKSRKLSVFFTASKPWNEESLVQGCREMSPSVASIFETAWNGDVTQLEQLLGNSDKVALSGGVNMDDIFGRTPLHLASACGHVDVVEFLLQKGADVEVCDFQQKATPLMCAAGCGSLACLEILLAHGANVNAGYDESGKTALHWAVQAESADCTRKLLESGALQNPPKAYSETALHVAAALGNLRCLQLLIEHGADVALIKGNTRSTSLHLAAEEGSTDCIDFLLKSGASHGAKDARGQTPLHIAAACDSDVTALLLEAGADPHVSDVNGRTPLHCAVARGSRAAECVRLIIEAGAEVNAQDCYGYTPLHLAGVNESSQCASILLNQGADVTAKTKAGTSALSVLVRKIPDVIRFLIERLDAAVTVHDHDPGDPDCEIHFDFRAIVPHSEKRDSDRNPKAQQQAQVYYHTPRKETEFLTCLLAAGNKKILAHPLSEAFLHLKWKCVRKFFWASLIFQVLHFLEFQRNSTVDLFGTMPHPVIALVLMYTVYVIQVYVVNCPYDKDTKMNRTAHLTRQNEAPPYVVGPQGFVLPKIIPGDLLPDPNDTARPRRASMRRYGFHWFSFNPKTLTTAPPLTTTASPASLSTFSRGFLAFAPKNQADPENDGGGEVKVGEEFCKLTIELTVVWCLLVFLTLIMAIKEIFQLVQAPLPYVISSENWGQWALIGSVFVTAWPPSDPELHLSYWQYPAAAFGIFLAYSLMLLQVGRQPALGLYVQMLGKVAANFGIFILAYICLLIAFALAFCVIYRGNPAYSSPPLALMKVLTMMVGEVDYEAQFYNEKDPLLYPVTAHVLHSAFVIFISIILMNLLVGLAVHDIQGLQKGAKLNRLSRQTALICRLESFIFSKRLQACLPKSLGTIMQKNALLVPSSYSWSFYFRPNDPRDKRLPKELKQAALRLAAANHASKHVAKHYAPPEARATKDCGVGFDASFRRLDKRMDRLQQQIDSVLQTLNDNSANIINLLKNDTSVKKTE